MEKAQTAEMNVTSAATRQARAGWSKATDMSVFCASIPAIRGELAGDEDSNAVLCPSPFSC